jgi:hypothetical protein
MRIPSTDGMPKRCAIPPDTLASKRSAAMSMSESGDVSTVQRLRRVRFRLFASALRLDGALISSMFRPQNAGQAERVLAHPPALGSGEPAENYWPPAGAGL